MLGWLGFSKFSDYKNALDRAGLEANSKIQRAKQDLDRKLSDAGKLAAEAQLHASSASNDSKNAEQNVRIKKQSIEQSQRILEQ